ncbi:MAG: flagellar hook-associated protein FlgK [Lachnospiraceae bacterium]|nr:flagellar hook-associated protein FlgK [Lachnospiraceae bacterium]
MGSFWTGVSGLQTSQNALNTTAHNLANIDTSGYTRQQVLQGNREYNKIGDAYISSMQVGLGVSYTDVRAIRDYFLDKSYRQEAGRSAYYSTSLEAVNEINTLFGETEGTEFQTSLQSLQNAMSDLADKPSDATSMSVVVSRAAQFLERAKAVYNGLCEYQDNLNEQIKDQVDTINDYAAKIHELNQKITRIETGGIEDANDLRDSRDYYLDQLSSMGRISYDEDAKGVVTVQFEGVNLVTTDYVNKMEARVMDETTGFYEVIWPKLNDQQVFSLNSDVSAEDLSDNGSLKALVYSRGDHRATYQDIVGGYEYTEEQADGTEVTKNATAEYAYSQIDSSSVMTIMAEFDNLVHNITMGIDRILTSEVDSSGDRVDKGEDYLTLFTTISSDDTNTRPSEGEVQDQSFYSNYTCNNLTINSDLLKQPTLLNNGFVLEDSSVDQTTADNLVELFSSADYINDLFDGSLASDGSDGKKVMTNLNATTLTQSDFADYYILIVEQYATVGNTYQSLNTSLELSVNSIEAQRQQVVGVSDNEELTKMIRYQNAYNANSRYMNTVNDMLEILLTSMT